MNRNLTLSIAVAAMIATGIVYGNAAPGAQQEATAPRQRMASVDYLVGSWSCAHTVGTFSGKYTTAYAKVLGNLWLKQTYEFPPEQAADRISPAVTAEALMGYDEPRQAWVRFFANSIGQYFAIRMTETGNGWSWKYVSFFKVTRPETPDADATLTKKSGTEYTIDGPSYEANGTRVTEHHSCHKL